MTKHDNSFINWFNEIFSNYGSASETIKWMSCMPKFNVITWTACDISNFSFYTKSKDNCSTMQNIRAVIEAKSMYFSSSNTRIV